MRDRFLVPFCGVMLSLNAISCDILMPAFFALERAFSATRTEIQAIMPIFLMAAAGGQILFGPLSDRYGRKPILKIGMAIYLVGTLLAALVPNLTGLYAARALQGFGASCMIVLARAMLRDSFSGDTLGRAMAFAMGIFVVGPMLAPLFGVLALEVGGWQGPFVALAFVAISLFIVQSRFRETNAAPDPRALEPRRLLSAMGRLFTNSQSRHFLLALIVCQMVVIVFVTNAPQMMKSSFGIEGFHFAWLFAIAATGIIVGQIINTKLIARFGLFNALRLVSVLSMAVAIATTVFASRLGVAGFIGLLFAFNATFLVLLTNGMTMVLEPHRDIAGTASAVLGSVTQFTGAFAALMALPYFDGSIAGWAPWHAMVMGAIALWVYSFRPDPTAVVKQPVGP